jgi:predicted RNase H-like nuclease (RuvC/YqgF family)
MALYDAKIERFSKRAEQLEKNIKRETEERKRLLSEITKLRYLQLCDKLNCDGEELVTVLAKEHDQIQKMKDRGMTDKDIDDLGRSDNYGEHEDQMRFYSEEDDDENENA